ncbi:MAG: ATP-dependent helicase [Candidatus Jordarchaeales archaeon]
MSVCYADRVYSKDEILSLLHPKVARWYSRFDPTPPQSMAIPLIHRGENVLITSPTGTGKTLAAFLTIMSELAFMEWNGVLEDKVYAVYVSPLRALNNDIKRNLLSPLEEMGLDFVRVSVRTGDTPANERQKMLRKPPHILITTPETLAIVLNATRFRDKLEPRWVVVDEIHALFESKRGAHLSLSLERLNHQASFQRIGLSATIWPLDEVARFLVGEGRSCVVVNASYAKEKDIRVETPVPDLVHIEAEKLNREMYRRLGEIIDEHRTTLVFTNTRSGAEKVAFHLQDSVDIDDIGTHHGSLSRDVRLDVEEKLKNGELKVVVSSTSLELGIDIGYIDCVVQIGSPKSITRCLQRIGRAGHRIRDVSKGVLLCMSHDDLLECAVMVKCAYDGVLDRASHPQNALDVLAQHLVGMALERKWNAEEAFNVVRRSYSFRSLSWDDFESALKYLSGGYGLEPYKVYGKVWYDEHDRVFGRRGKYARVIYMLNLGTIPDEVAIKVYALPGKRYVGNIEEEFLERLEPGDIFVLGGRVYEFVRASGLNAYVKDAKGKKPTIPSWFSEMLPLSFDLACEIRRFIEKVFRGEIGEEELKEEYRVSDWAAKAILNFLRLEKEFLGKLGIEVNGRSLLVEEFEDEDGRQNFLFMFLFGRRVNDALSRAYAWVASREVGANVGLAVTDHGFMLTVPRKRKLDVRLVVSKVSSSNLRDVLSKAIRSTEMFRRRFRHVAARSFMVLRNYKGHEIGARRQMRNAEVLMKAVSEFDGFPIVKETEREIMEDVMDVKNAIEVLKSIERGELEIIHVKTPVPSPLAHGVYLSGLSDVVLMEDRLKLLEYLYQRVVEESSCGENH